MLVACYSKGFMGGAFRIPFGGKVINTKKRNFI